MTLATEQMEVRYANRTACKVASLSFARGELVGLVGPNGAGKTTLLRALAGVGEGREAVSWDGAPITRLDDRQRARSIAYVPQTPPVHWPLRVRELVSLGRLPHRGFGTAPRISDRDAVHRALVETRTLELADRSIDELSMGERARVLLARALAVQAPALLLDEPIAALDPYHQLELMQLLRGYTAGAAGGALVVVVLHNLTLAARFCSRALLMDRGVIVEDDVPSAALCHASIRRHYRVEPFIAAHQGSAVIVPWQPIGERKMGGP